MPSAPTRPDRSARPAGWGPAYPSSAARVSTRSRSAGLSWSGRLKAFETVVRETPSASARVWSVTRPGTAAGLSAAGADRGVGARGERQGAAAVGDVEDGEGGDDHGETPFWIDQDCIDTVAHRQCGGVRLARVLSR